MIQTRSQYFSEDDDDVTMDGGGGQHDRRGPKATDFEIWPLLVAFKNKQSCESSKMFDIALFTHP